MRKTITKEMACTQCGVTFTAHSNARKFCDACAKQRTYESRKRIWTAANRRHQASTYKPGKNKLQCLVCGAWVKAPAMHAYQRHRITAHEYKEHFEIPFGKGLLPTYLKEIKRDHVFKNGTVNNLPKGKAKRFKKGEARVYDGVKRRLELKQITKLDIC